MNLYIICHHLRRTCRPLAVGLLVQGLGTISAGSANAFSFSESGFSDLYPDRPVDFLLQTMSLGVNLMNGSSACIGFGCSDLYDSLRFEVPNGLQISLTDYVVTENFNTAFGAILYVFANDGITVLDPPNDPDFITNPPNPLITLNTNTVGEMLQSSLVLGPGLYDVVSVNGGNNRFTAQFTAAVPEPATSTLVVGAVLAAAVRRRR